MDFLCCSERWTCPSRPRFPLLNLHHIAHRGCFHSLWPKWNYLLLKLKHSKEATEWSRTVWTSISSPRGRAFHALWESQKATRKQNKFCKFALKSDILIVSIHKISQGNLQQHVSQCRIHSVGTLTVCIKTWMMNYHTRAIENIKRIPQDECWVANTNTYYSAGLTQKLFPLW